MKLIHYLFFLALGSGIMLNSCTTKSEEKVLSFGDLPFEMPDIIIPQFKTDTFNVVDFGAIADGVTVNTTAINSAIKACSDNGGGVVLLKAGIWLSGPIVLQNNVNLHLENGALLQFSNDLSLYPLVFSYYEGLKAPRCQNPVSANNLENIAITGDGVIDGAGDAWRQIKKEKLTDRHWKEVTSGGGIVVQNRIWYPTEAHYQGELKNRKGELDYSSLDALKPYKDFFRPQMISLVNCKYVLLDGPTFQNSPAWNIHPLMCEHITVRNVNVRNPWYSQNGDGIDLESCRIGAIYNSTFDVGDDAICIKSGKDQQGRDLGKPTELIVVENCTVYHGHGGFVIGSEMSGGVRKMYVENCTFLGTDCGLRFKSKRGRGGVVEDIYMKNIRMTNIPTDAIRFNLYYGGKSVVEDDEGNIVETEAVPVTEETPSFRNLFFEDIICTNVERGINIRGIPEMPVKNLSMKNISITANHGINSVYAEDVKIENLKLDVKQADAIEIQNSNNIDIQAASITGYSNKIANIKGSKTTGVKLGVSNVENLKELVSLQGTSSNEITLQ